MRCVSYIIIYIFFIICIFYCNVCIAEGINNVLAAYGVANMKVGCRRLPILDTSTTQNFNLLAPELFF